MDDSERAVLRSIYRLQPVTRRTVAGRTGLGPGRVSTLVARLLAAGLVSEHSGQESGPGRPAASLAINSDAGRVVGLDIGGTESRAALVDLGGRVLCAVTQPTEAVPERATILQNMQRLVESVCAAGGVDVGNVAGLGVGVGGIVDTRSGRVLGWPNTPAWAPAWQGVDLAGELQTRLGVAHVVVEDSVLALATNAHRHGPARGCDNFLYIFLGNGVGSALVIDGQPYRSGTGLAGEIGHITLDENGPWCTCGNRGCLEVFASTEAVLERVRGRLAEARPASRLSLPFMRGELTLAHLIEAAHDGDKIAFQVLDSTGGFVGRVVAIALNLFGPELVVLGGPLVHDGGVLLEAVRRQARLRALQQISSRSRIVADDPDEYAAARGAASLATDRLFQSDTALIGTL